MSEILPIAEIWKRHPAEWVAIGEPQANDQLVVQAGRILAHSPDRDEVHRTLMELRPERFAILYTGTTPEGMAILL